MIKQHKMYASNNIKNQLQNQNSLIIIVMENQSQNLNANEKKIPLIINIIKINMMCAIIFKRKLHTFFVLCGSQPPSPSRSCTLDFAYVLVRF